MNIKDLMPGLLEMRKNGLTYAEIADRLTQATGVEHNHRTLWQQMRKLGAPRSYGPKRDPKIVPKGKIPTARHMAWFRAYRADVPIAEIARREKVTRQAVHYAVSRLARDGYDCYIVADVPENSIQQVASVQVDQ